MIYLILFLSFILRLISINQSFWLDEATSATVAKNLTFIDIVRDFSPADFHPPLYYELLKLWTLPFGVTEISTRMLSIGVGVLTIYLVYQIGKKLVNQSVGVMAALLLAISPLHIYYSQEARMYSLQTLFVTLAVFLYVVLKKKESVWMWLFFSLSIVLAGFTDYLPLLIIPVFWIESVVSKRKLNWYTKLALSHIPLLLGFSLWMPVFVKQFVSGLAVSTTSSQWWKVLGRSSIKELALVPTKFILGRIKFESSVVYAAVVGLSVVFYSYLLFWATKLFKKTSLLWLWLVFPVFAAFILGFRVSVFSYFRLIFVLPALSLLLAVGLSKIKEALFPFTFVLLVILNISFSWMYLSNPKFHREDWRGAAQTIKITSADKKTVVLFPSVGQQEALKYYLADVKISTPQDVDFSVESFDRVWLVRYVVDISDPKDTAREIVETAGYNKSLEHNFNGVVIWEYTNENSN